MASLASGRNGAVNGKDDRAENTASERSTVTATAEKDKNDTARRRPCRAFCASAGQAATASAPTTCAQRLGLSNTI